MVIFDSYVSLPEGIPFTSKVMSNLAAHPPGVFGDFFHVEIPVVEIIPTWRFCRLTHVSKVVKLPWQWKSSFLGL